MATMAEQPADRAVSGWAYGFAAFAGAIMLIVGIFQGLAGLAAIIDDDFFVVGSNYAFKVDTTTWGWIHMIFGIILIFAGLAIYRGAVWARTIGVILAILSAIANFFFIPYYPVWAVLIIALDIAIIWALVVYGRDAAEGY